MNYILCAIDSILDYEKYFIKNPLLENSSIRIIPLVKKNKTTTGAVYNTFLNTLGNDADWLLFCPSALELLEDPFQHLPPAPKDAESGQMSLYGPWGARVTRNALGKVVQECLGSITTCPPDAEPHILSNLPEPGKACAADTLDSLFLAAPAALFRKFGLNFNTALQNLVAEEFCLRAFCKFAVPAHILGIRAQYHARYPADAALVEQDKALCDADLFSDAPKACVHTLFGGEKSDTKPIMCTSKAPKMDSVVYAKKISKAQHNEPIVLASHFLRDTGHILDLGCSGGDSGLFFSSATNAALYGMEYDEASLQLAHKKNIYTKLHQIDLNTFSPQRFSQYYRFFDQILLLDVLEHLVSPFDVLEKLQNFLDTKGTFIVSIPNIAHMYPVTNLLKQNFDYLDSGILDSTHLRFFTWKTLADKFSKTGLKVVQCVATFAAPETSTMLSDKTLPEEFYDYMLNDMHFFVCQYICELLPSEEPYAVLKERNALQLSKSRHTNNDGWKAIQDGIVRFKDKVNFIRGKGLPSSVDQRVAALIKEKKYFEAAYVSGFFDEAWYRKNYDDVDFTNIHPLMHYLDIGWQEGRDPSEAFSTAWNKAQIDHPDLKNVCPLLFYLEFAFREGMPYSKKCLSAPRKDAFNYMKYTIDQSKTNKKSFVESDTEAYLPEENDTKLIAFFLPQFAPFPENDQWWGKGFTEWTNVTKAVPQFIGHYQPRLPYDVGFYDLRVKETRLRQEELAKHYGIHGFCYHYYWFDGKKIMNGPVEKKLKDEEQALPFCISWANEAWNATWTGTRNGCLLDQPDSVKTQALFQELLPFFEDERYIRIDGKPFFMVYRPAYFSRSTFCKFVDEFRTLAQKYSIEPFLALGKIFRNEPIIPLGEYGADAYVEFPPNMFTYEVARRPLTVNKSFKGLFYDLPKLIELSKKAVDENFTFKTVFPMWDNTARKAESGASIFLNSSPQLYYEWLSWAIKETKNHHSPIHNLVFINAWNEWAEGAYLEPDMKYGYDFLQKTKKALYDARGKSSL